MAKSKKYYVVWNGKTKGVFNSWNDCKKQIDGFQGAQYKSFTSKEEAEIAFTKTYEEYKGKDTKKPIIDKMSIKIISHIIKNHIIRCINL